ncbi:MAG TPA: DNA-formamidopyrimidine glycosylase family protein [Solirubrobacterales bacterium]|jgi:endonuclease-8
MAEGDTIHRTARRLNAALGGERVLEVAVPNPRSPLRRQSARLGELRGSRLASVEARGKHLLLHFEPGLALHCHLGMNGSWRVVEPGGEPSRPERSAWVILTTEHARAAQFGGTHLALRTAGELRADPRLSRLGPDLLAPGFQPAAGAGALRKGTPGQALGEALLDQRLVAGVGNVYKSEGCFAASLNPWRSLSELTDADLERLFDALRDMMQAGVTDKRRPRLVYRRAGGPCAWCGTRIRSRGQGDANRVTYWCPRCQP